MELKF